jgi:hypothetical protein
LAENFFKRSRATQPVAATSEKVVNGNAPMTIFASWLADVLQGCKSDVDCLLDDETALHFLVAWSLFESKCFSGFLRAKCRPSFAEKAVREGFAPLKVNGQLEHFHGRYSDKKKLAHLLHDETKDIAVVKEFRRCLASPLTEMQDGDRVFAVAFVIYRFRNNMFHGNKRVESWLRYREQISLCTGAMQEFVAHAQQVKPAFTD